MPSWWHGSNSSSTYLHAQLPLAWLLLLLLGQSCAHNKAAASAAEESGIPTCTQAALNLKIPRIIHRNYMEGRVAMYAATQVSAPSWQLHWLISCKSHHPTWAEMVWAEEDILGLITEEYPWFLDTYLAYAKHVFRSDLARFVILHKHGGVYLDADVECYKNMEPSLAGLDLVINCRTYDVAHNAAMASIAGHPVWIEAMKAAMAVVLRQRPGVSGDPLTATGPVLMSQTVQQYYGISKEQFCDRLHVKHGLVLKAYPKGQWFTPCWPWANLVCYKRLETTKKFLVRSDPSLVNVVGVHHYSGTWFGQASSSKDKLRQRNRMLAAEATVSFFWESPHFVEHKCNSAAAAAAGSKPVGFNSRNYSSSVSNKHATSTNHSSSMLQRPVHRRPGPLGAAVADAASAAVVWRLRHMLNAPDVAGGTADATAQTPVGTPPATETTTSVPASGSDIFSCPTVLKLARLQPCMVLSFIQSVSSAQSAAAAAAQTPDTMATSSNSSGSSSSTYWANLDNMLSELQQSHACHVTVADTDAATRKALVQLAAARPPEQSINSEAMGTDWNMQPQAYEAWMDQQSYLPVQLHAHDPPARPPAATFIDAGAASPAAPAADQQGPNAAQVLVQLLQQQRMQQLHALGCDSAAAGHRFPAVLACKAPARHTVLHLSCSADYLADLAKQIYSHSAESSHPSFEQHGRYPAAVYQAVHDQSILQTVSSPGSNSQDATRSNSSRAENTQNIITALDSIDILLIDVERPTGASAHRQAWSVLYNLLYQLHGYVGFVREALPDGRTRLGWIRRPERTEGGACQIQQQQQQ